MAYKDTLLGNLKSLLHDVISEDKITPNEIYDCIQKTVTENYYYHKHHTGRSYELMTKFNDYNPWEEYFSTEDYSKNRMHHQDYINAGYEMTADGFWIPPKDPKDNNSKQQYQYQPCTSYYTAKVEVDSASGEYYVTIPPALLKKLNWKESDDLIITLQEDKSLRITGPTKPTPPTYADGFSVLYP